MPEPAVNFGAMLAVLGRWAEAIVTLEGALPKLDPAGRAAVSALVEQCRDKPAANAQAPPAN